MKKIMLIASVLLILVLLVSCDMPRGQDMIEDGTQENVKMTAVVKTIGYSIEVEVVEGDYGAAGIFWVNFSSDTTFVNANNQTISPSDLKVGDIIEITYSGQVALSYPPQIYAKKIQIK